MDQMLRGFDIDHQTALKMYKSRFNGLIFFWYVRALTSVAQVTGNTFDR